MGVHREKVLKGSGIWNFKLTCPLQIRPDGELVLTASGDRRRYGPSRRKDAQGWGSGLALPYFKIAGRGL